MGGQIFVGIRTADGVEHLGTTWTNWLPTFFMEPDLYTPTGGETIKQLLSAWAEGHGPYNKRLNRIVHSEYGVILLDLKLLPGETKPVIWSANDYTTPLRPVVSMPCMTTNPDTDRLLLHHMKRGCPIEAIIEGHDGWALLSKTQVDGIIDVYERSESGALTNDWGANGVSWAWRNLFPKGAEYRIGKLTLDMATAVDGEARDQATWDQMKVWLAQRGWQAPVNKRVR